jgi:hypothetical protein
VKVCDRTISIAEQLSAHLAKSDDFKGIKVFYDHGESGQSSVWQPTSYMGRRYGSDATLSGIDIVIVRNGKAFLAVEVEESYVRPKTVLGDVFGIALANRVRIQGRTYPIHEALLMVAVVVGSSGRRREKYARLERHIGKYIRALQTSSPRTNIKKVRVITTSQEDLVRRVERFIRLEVGKHLGTSLKARPGNN